MEILAENRTIVTKKLFCEGFLRLSRDGYGKSAAKAMLFFVGLWVALLVYTLSIGGSIFQTIGCLLLVGFIGLWLCVITPRNSAKRAWKRHAARYGESMERTVRFYRGQFTLTSEDVEKTVSYAEIQQIKTSRNLQILLCEDGMGILLDKNGFTKGDAERVCRLVNNEAVVDA